MESKDFIEEMTRLKEGLAEARRWRHERNEAFSQVINEIRLDAAEVEGRVSSLETSIKVLVESNRQLVDALQGGLLGNGLIAASNGYDSRLKELESWRNQIKSFIAGAVFIAGIVGGLIGFLADKLFK